MFQHESFATPGEIILTKDGSCNLTPEVVAGFRNYVYNGGIMIRDGEYDKAVDYFEKPEALTKVGKKMGKATNLYINDDDLSTLNPAKYKKLVDAVAKKSHHDWGSRVVLSKIIHIDANEQVLPLPARLQHEVALVHMEEWLHVVQGITKKPLAGHPDAEIDVAFYMQRNGIPMTQAFLNRHDRRVAIEQTRGAVNSNLTRS